MATSIAKTTAVQSTTSSRISASQLVPNSSQLSMRGMYATVQLMAAGKLLSASMTELGMAGC